MVIARDCDKESNDEGGGIIYVLLLLFFKDLCLFISLQDKSKRKKEK